MAGGARSGQREIVDALKEMGGRWNPKKRVWEVRYDRVLDLDLAGPIAWKHTDLDASIYM